MTHFSVFAKNDYEKWQQGLYVADTQDGFNLVSWKDAYKRSMSITKVDETDDDDGDEYVSEVAHPWIFIVQKHIYMQNHEIERDDDFKITKACEDAISKIKPKKSQFYNFVQYEVSADSRFLTYQNFFGNCSPQVVDVKSGEETELHTTIFSSSGPAEMVTISWESC